MPTDGLLDAGGVAATVPLIDCEPVNEARPLTVWVTETEVVAVTAGEPKPVALDVAMSEGVTDTAV
jgi:hypothetical protein